MSFFNQFLIITIISISTAILGAMFLTDDRIKFLTWNTIDVFIFDNYKTKRLKVVLEEVSTEFSEPTETNEKASVSEKKLTTYKLNGDQVKEDFLSNQTKIINNIPFTTQAPLAEWDDPRQKYGCEEALMVMAWHWIKGESLNPLLARAHILDLVKWQQTNKDEYLDTSTKDTAAIFKQYFGHENIKVISDVNITDIKQAINNNQLVFIPADGQKLNNPYFKPPGPMHHMFLIKGYDDKTEEFIANDPGTLFGENIRYSYDTIERSLRDYPTGLNKEIDTIDKLAILISKP